MRNWCSSLFQRFTFFELFMHELLWQAEAKCCFPPCLKLLLRITASSGTDAKQLLSTAAVSHIPVFISTHDSNHKHPSRLDLLDENRRLSQRQNTTRATQKPSDEKKQTHTKEFRSAAAPWGSTLKFWSRALERSTPDWWRLAELQPINGLTFL